MFHLFSLWYSDTLWYPIILRQLNVMFLLLRLYPIRKKQGSCPLHCPWAARGQRSDCPWVAHGYFAMQIRLPTTSIYGNSGQLSRHPTASKYEKVGSSVGSGVRCPWCAHGNVAMQIRLPTTSIYGYGSPLLPNMKKWAAQWAVEWAAHGLPMGILSWKLSCPLFPYTETVGNSVGSGVGCPWEIRHANKATHYFHIRIIVWAQWAAHCFQIRQKWAAQWAVERAAHGNFAMQIKLLTTFIYWDSGQRSGLPMDCPWEFRHANMTVHFFHIGEYYGQLSGQLSGHPTTFKYGNSG